MQGIALVFLVLLGLAVILRLVSRRRAGELIFWLILALLAGPVLYGVGKTWVAQFLGQDHPWWVYPLAGIVFLVALRFAMDMILGRRRED